MLTIRPARPGDEAVLAEIDERTWSEAVSPAPAPPAGTAFFNERSQPEDHLVAEVEGAVVGYVRLNPLDGLPSHHHVLAVNGLAVHPGRQGRGVGRSLVDAAVEEARGRGMRKLSLRVLGTNPGAIHLYQSCGFVVEGTLRGEFHLGDRYVDDLFMARHLIAEQ